MTSDERAVAQIGVELLQANPIVERSYQIALADADEGLALPCVVVTADREESEVVRIAVGWVNRYKLRLELRGIQRQHPTDALDEAFSAIDTALFPTSIPTLPSSGLVSYWMIDKQTGSSHSVTNDIRNRTRDYDVFAKAA
jgi:hypothetical protein